MKKILIIAYYFPPDNNGGTERVKHFYYRLKNNAYDTYVLTVNRKMPDKEKINDTHIIRKSAMWYCLRAYEGMLRKHAVKLPIFLKLAKLFLRRTICKIKPDICIASFPLVHDFYIGIMLKEMNIQLVSDFRDGLLYEPFDLVTNANQLYQDEMKIVESNIAKLSDLIITTTPQITEYMENAYNVKAYTIPNGFDDKEVFTESPIRLSKDKINVLYTGALDLSRPGAFSYANQCFHYMFKDNPNIAFHFIGQYTDEEKDFFSNYDNVQCHAKTSRARVIATQRNADVLLLISGEAKGITKGKLYEYIFSSKPILNLGGCDNASRIIKETNSGITFQSSQRKEINDFFQNQVIGSRCCQFERNKEALKKYTREYQCNYLMQLIDQIKNPKNLHENKLP